MVWCNLIFFVKKEIEKINLKIGNIKFNFNIFHSLKILRLISRVLEESRYTI